MCLCVFVFMCVCLHVGITVCLDENNHELTVFCNERMHVSFLFIFIIVLCNFSKFLIEVLLLVYCDTNVQVSTHVS